MVPRQEPDLSLARAAIAPRRRWHTRRGRYGVIGVYALAVASVALATMVTLWLWPLLRPTATSLFFAAVMVSAWAGGLGPGLVATTLSALSMEYFLVLSSFTPGRWYVDLIRVEVFVFVALLITGLNAARRRAEDTLAASQRVLQATLDSLSAQIAILDGGGIIIAINAAWQRGFAPAGGDGRPVGAVGSPYVDVWRAAGAETGEAGTVEQGLREVLAGQRADFAGEFGRGQGEGRRAFAVRLARCEGEGAVRVVVAHEDITQRKAAEASQRREESLRSVTRLASAAAHEINNPLAIIMGNVEIIAQHVDPVATARIRPTLDAVERIRLIVQRMTRITDLKLYEQSPSLPEMLDLRRSSPALEPHQTER